MFSDVFLMSSVFVVNWKIWRKRKLKRYKYDDSNCVFNPLCNKTWSKNVKIHFAVCKEKQLNFSRWSLVDPVLYTIKIDDIVDDLS